MLLVKKGYRVTTATNGREAVEKALEETPLLLLLIDLAMPIQDGAETIYMFKQSETLKHVPTVMITAIDNDVAKKISSWAGADYFINKPFDNEEIVKTVELIITKQKLANFTSV